MQLCCSLPNLFSSLATLVLPEILDITALLITVLFQFLTTKVFSVKPTLITLTTKVFNHLLYAMHTKITMFC